jgi:hypothetical protein
VELGVSSVNTRAGTCRMPHAVNMAGPWSLGPGFPWHCAHRPPLRGEGAGSPSAARPCAAALHGGRITNHKGGLSAAADSTSA